MSPALVDHRLLNWRQRTIGRVHTFDRDDVFSRSVRKRHQAGSHRAISNTVSDQLADEYRARTAIALATADLRALEIFVIANEVEHRRPRGEARVDVFVVKNETSHNFCEKNTTGIKGMDGIDQEKIPCTSFIPVKSKSTNDDHAGGDQDYSADPRERYFFYRHAEQSEVIDDQRDYHLAGDYQAECHGDTETRN